VKHRGGGGCKNNKTRKKHSTIKLMSPETVWLGGGKRYEKKKSAAWGEKTKSSHRTKTWGAGRGGLCKLWDGTIGCLTQQL